MRPSTHGFEAYCFLWFVGIFAVLLKASDNVAVPSCWDDLMEEQRGLGMFGLHNLAWHPDLVEAACNTRSLDSKTRKASSW